MNNNTNREDEGDQASSPVPHARIDEGGQAPVSNLGTRENERHQVSSSVSKIRED